MGTFSLHHLDSQIDEGNEINAFRDLCEKISRLVSSEKVAVVPFRDSSVPIFNSLPPKKRSEVLLSIQIYSDILEQTLSRGHRLTESKQLSWSAFKCLKLTPHSEFFNHIGEDSVVEIYTADGIQIFRNLKFFEICSYTLEDIYCRPWFELYGRDPKVIETISAHVGKVLAGENREPYHPQIGLHYLQEKDSPFKYKLALEIDCISPVIDENGSPGSYFSGVESVNIVNKLSDVQKDEMLTNFYERTPPVILGFDCDPEQ